MKKNLSKSSIQYQEYFNFFLQLPITESIEDIKIEDDVELPHDLTVHGLSDEQVSQIALDSLRDARRHHRQRTEDEGQTSSPSRNE
jgi:hypothetical protein